MLILAGGLGTRISEETINKPKPMVKIGSKPILWHIMNIYASQGFSDFVIATGYKHEVIDEWVKKGIEQSWSVETLFTGLDTQTAGRIRQGIEFIDEDRIFATYGDGLGSIDIGALVTQHQKMGKLATVTAVRPPARFGVLEFSNGLVTHFGEKNQADAGWINGGFFVIDRNIVNLVTDDSDPFESITLPRLVERGDLSVYEHEGFWQPMDTLREKEILDKFANSSRPPWLAH